MENRKIGETVKPGLPDGDYALHIIDGELYYKHNPLGIDVYCGGEEKFHKIYNDPIIGGLLIGVQGACKYILDYRTLKKMTRGYHRFWMHEGTLYGEIGARKEMVFVDD